MPAGAFKGGVPVKALAITLAAGAALWAGSVPLQPKLAAAASDLASGKSARWGLPSASLLVAVR
jgi:hypothetical protein